tara:strand:- start:665 stop:1096 length:432 start_codon:yes stop_codon:yes gene_type:complete
MKLFTIGFTKTSAQNFFERLKNAKVRRIIDVRKNNISQLAGFAKEKDLKYFSKEIGNIDYFHNLELAPTKELIDGYRKKEIDWKEYESVFNALLKERKVEDLDPKLFKNACLLCSEDVPHQCHRRLVAEYLKKFWKNLEIIHL